MEKTQRYKYEMLVRVRDYGKARGALFPQSSTGGKLFEQVEAAVAAIDTHLKNRVIGMAEARKVKATIRNAVYGRMKMIAMAARRVNRSESDANPFRMPRRRSLTGEIATARAFLEGAATRQEQFQRFGLPAEFIREFESLVDDLQRVVSVRLNSKTVRGEAKSGLRTSLAEGLEHARDLDVIVSIATRQDPVSWAAWQSARRIEGLRAKPRSRTTPPEAVGEVPPAASDPAPVAAPAAGPAPAPLPTVLDVPITLGRAS